jgi:hypothetical protein
LETGLPDARSDEGAELCGDRDQQDARAIGQIEEAEQKRDQDPRQEGRADAAVEEGAEQAERHKRLNRKGRRDGKLSRPLHQERHQPEEAEIEFERPEHPIYGGRRLVQEYDDGMAQQRARTGAGTRRS